MSDSRSSSHTESEEDFSMLLLLYVLRKKRRRKRSEYLKDRIIHGAFAMTKQMTSDCFTNFHRLSKVQFQEVLGMIGSAITAVGCNAQRPVPADEKLAVFLRYMASGDTYKSLGYSFRLGDRTVSRIVKEVAIAVWKIMQPVYLPSPAKEHWMKISKEFEERWQFPHCVGAIDGKHILIKKPAKSGSSYFNYKHNFSIVLMAAVDAKYKFTFIDIGSKGRFSDGNIFSSSELGKRLAHGTLELPMSDVVGSFPDPLPYVFVGDEAFPLMENLMRPYPQRSVTGIIENKVFNYRLSRARQTVECSFGILASRFRIFQKPFEIKVRSIIHVVKAACVLHNYLRKHAESYGDHETTEAFNDHVHTEQLLPLSGRNSRSGIKAYDSRKRFTEYFNSVGSVQWQEESVSQGKY